MLSITDVTDFEVAPSSNGDKVACKDIIILLFRDSCGINWWNLIDLMSLCYSTYNVEYISLL